MPFMEAECMCARTCVRMLIQQSVRERAWYVKYGFRRPVICPQISPSLVTWP